MTINKKSARRRPALTGRYEKEGSLRAPRVVLNGFLTTSSLGQRGGSQEATKEE